MAELTISEKISKWWRGIPDKKKYIEVLSAILTVPVLITVILLNLGSLKNKDEKSTPTPQVITIVPIEKDSKPSPTDKPQCRKEVGPVEITSPKEGQSTSDNPVCFNIEYKDERYCSVVWSYRIDNSSWSDFTDKIPCVSNLSSGDHKFELRVRSIASSDEVQLVRNFTFKGPDPTPTPTPTPSTGL